MKKFFRTTFSLILVTSIVFCFPIAASIADNELETPADDPVLESIAISENYRKIYTGTGSAITLGVYPQQTPFYMTIKMVDYNGTTVWEEGKWYIATSDHEWYIGANVQYVYLKAMSSVDVSLAYL